MNTIQRLQGFQDVLPDEQPYWDLIGRQARLLAERFGFQRLDIPIIENSDLYQRGVGTGSDFFVQKEMYTIEEGDGESITLRPEFTAGFMRAYLENGLSNWVQPVKLYTIGPAFRRERPQAGRFRQHSQFNAEIIGESDPAADLEVMMLAMSLYRELGFAGLTFQLNSTGCPACKPTYIEALKTFLQDHLEKLSPLDQERLRRNPLRILDSKEKGMDELLADAPHILNYLCADCESHFADLRGLLDALEQSYTINFRLVRGIDYYTKTVFEVWAEGIGAQAAVCGGGRYDILAEALGGPPTPGVGFGSGIERIIRALKENGVHPPLPPVPSVMLVHFGGRTKEEAVKLTYTLRQAGIATRLAFARERRSLKSQLREANKQQIQTVIIVGESELAEGKVALRPLTGGEQTFVALSEVVGVVSSFEF
ncbi:MAG: histidine--tRNA ligase [Anaerolineae bacterium]|nr:histidine--tRNA ligase [Anaerolineae bacterium]